MGPYERSSTSIRSADAPKRSTTSGPRDRSRRFRYPTPATSTRRASNATRGSLPLIPTGGHRLALVLEHARAGVHLAHDRLVARVHVRRAGHARGEAPDRGADGGGV